MGGNQIEVGARIIVVKPTVTGGKYGRNSEGTIVNILSDRGVRVKFDRGITAPLYNYEFDVLPRNPLDSAKTRLAGTQRIYDETSETLESAKAAFKLADEAHGKAIAAYDKAYREAEAKAGKFTEADVKNLMVVDAGIFNRVADLRLVVISGDAVRFYAENGDECNSCTRSSLVRVLNNTYKKTDLPFTPNTTA